jgi:hypothetical protein
VGAVVSWIFLLVHLMPLEFHSVVYGHIGSLLRVTSVHLWMLLVDFIVFAKPDE